MSASVYFRTNCQTQKFIVRRVHSSTILWSSVILVNGGCRSFCQLCSLNHWCEEFLENWMAMNDVAIFGWFVWERCILLFFFQLIFWINYHHINWKFLNNFITFLSIALIFLFFFLLTKLTNEIPFLAIDHIFGCRI